MESRRFLADLIVALRRRALMEIRLHANATTTPKQRAYIQQSARPATELAEELRVSETTHRPALARVGHGSVYVDRAVTLSSTGAEALP